MECAGFLAGVMMTGVVFAQDLPPGVLLLSRVKNHFKEELQLRENISCLETVEREQQQPKGKMRPLDTVRLEVLAGAHKELYASPGDRKFTDAHPSSFAGSGVLSDGIFGMYLKDVLLGAPVSNTYKGEEEIGGRLLARYDYRLPLMWSGQSIQTLEGSGTVGLHGSYWVDPQTYDVVLLDLVADDIPPTLPIIEMTTRIKYARTRLSDSMLVLLPESAEVHIASFTGEISNNRMDFTHCRVFSAEAKVNFDAPDAAEATPRFGASSVDDTLRALPAGLEIAVKLRTPVSSDMTVGALIEGVVAGNVSMKGKLVIAAGSAVRGRIRRLEHYTDPFPHFVVALEFTELQVEGIRYRFFADPVDIEPIAGVEPWLRTQEKYERTDFFDGARMTWQSRENLVLYDLPGVASFFFKATKFDLPQGFRTVWKTRPLKP
jgi:hypothetical protein